MAFNQKTFRKCGSHFSDLSALDGLEVKVGENFRPPRKVTLPVGFHLTDPSDILSLMYDFSLENEVIAKAEASRAKTRQKEEEENTKEQVSPPTHTSNHTAVQASPNPVFSNVGTDILQPTAVPATGHKRNNSLGQGSNSFDLADFENNTSTPFELVELQTINDLDELKYVLQSVSQASTSQTQSVPSSNIVGSTEAVTSITDSFPSTANAYHAQQNEPKQTQQPQQPFTYLSNSNPVTGVMPINIGQQATTNLTSTLSKSVPDLSSNQLVDLSGPGEMVNCSPNPRSGSPLANILGNHQDSDCPSGYGISQPPVSHIHGIADSQFSRQALPSHNPLLINVGNAEDTPPELPARPRCHMIADSQFSRPVLPHGNPLLINAGNAEDTPPELPAKSRHHTTTSTVGSSSAGSSRTLYCPLEPGFSSQTSQGFGAKGCQLPPLQKPPTIPPRLSTTGQNRPIPAPRKLISPSGSTLVGSVVSDGLNTSPTARPVPLSRPSLPTKLQKSKDVLHAPRPLLHLRRRTEEQRADIIVDMDINKHHSSPLPPIGSSPLPPSEESSLPDPMPILTEPERTMVNCISTMGFSIPRVARAVQRLGANDREVIDYLVAVEELCQAGYKGDDVEIAMGLNNFDERKAQVFLVLSQTFKTLGFKETHIQEALKAADNDSDKALDFLTSISA